MWVCVVGLGLIGGSAALTLREKNFATSLIGVDDKATHAELALTMGLVDKVETLAIAVNEADLVILAIPVNAICKILPQVLDLITDKTTVTDVGSTKANIAFEASKHSRQKQFVPSHPMAGTENSGPQAAIPHLFRGKTAVICDHEKTGTEHWNKVKAMYEALEMRCIYMDSKQHDIHAAFVSHLSHISSFVLANTVLDMEKNTSTIFDLAGGGFESTVRLAKSSPEMWLPIFEQNGENILQALDAYIRHLEAFRKSLKEKKPQDTKNVLVKANEIRRVLESMNKGKM
jgi:prephenate dehydrogenase